MRGSSSQRKAYKTSLDKIYKKNIELGIGMTKLQIERDVKTNAGFKWESTTHKDVTTDDMTNLIIWCDLYGDDFGLDNGFTTDENDDLDFNRT